MLVLLHQTGRADVFSQRKDIKKADCDTVLDSIVHPGNAQIQTGVTGS